MNTDDIILSIYVPTFNHEKYIERALDSIKMQCTDYTYEVLVGEDCSTDNTRNVLKEYERKNPGFAHYFYRDHNMYNETPNNAADLKMRCKGKYIIALEGDDYWIDPFKLNKQITFLEEHADYVAVSHNCVVVDENSEPNGEKYPECYDTEYTIEHYMKGILPGQLTTLMFRNYYKNEFFDLSFIKTNIQPGDRKLYFSLICSGKIFCMQESMSAYRHVTMNGSSYSAKVRYDFKKQMNWLWEQLQYAYRIKNPRGIKCAEYLYVKEVLYGVKHKSISLGDALRYFRSIHNFFGSIWMLIRNR